MSKKMTKESLYSGFSQFWDARALVNTLPEKAPKAHIPIRRCEEKVMRRKVVFPLKMNTNYEYEFSKFGGKSHKEKEYENCSCFWN